MTHSDLKEYEDKLPPKLLKELEEQCPASKLKKAAKLLYEEYNASKIAPGEAVGLVGAESMGEPGTQMCVSYDEKVIFKFNNQVRITKVGEFVDRIFERVKTRKKDFYEVYNMPEDLFVLSLDKDEKLKWCKTLALNRALTPEKLVRITTQSGRSITATDFHSFVTREHNDIVSIAGKDLQVGDRIPVLQYLPEHCISTLAVNNYVENVVENNDRLVSEKSKIAKSIPKIIDLDKLFGWFVGAYLSEGNATNGQVMISNVNDKFISNAREFIKKIGLDCKEEWNNRGFSVGRDFKVSSTLFAKFMKSICNTGFAEKKVPSFAFSSKEEFVSGLLKGYFDGDGNVTVARKMIRASSNSEELIRGITLLLTRFRIFSFIKKSKNSQWNLLIPYKYARIFLEKIGSDIDSEKEKLKILADQSKNFWNNCSQDYTDMISGFDDLLYNAAKKAGLQERYINNFTKRQKIGRTTLFRYLQIFEKLAKKRNVNLDKELEIMKRIIYSDVVWDEIVKIEYVNPTSKYVYDLSVPNTHTFATFNGIITHNTLNTFHFAGVAEMNVTTGLPRIIEILDARKTISTPLMDIYLKSPHNKGKDIKEIAMSLKETKMNTFVKEYSMNIMEFKINLVLNEAAMKEHNTTLNNIGKALEKALVKEASIKIQDGVVEVKLKRSEGKGLNDLYKLKEKIKESYVSGIKGITQVLPVKRKEEFIIITAGTNMKKILELDFVDPTKTNTNDIHEISKTLGIEAARQAIIDEVFKVVESQGLNIDMRHLMLIADTMCSSGEVKGLTRYGIVSEKSSVLARASFENTIKHIIEASLSGEVDSLNSVVENVMINQPVPLGTGLPNLVSSFSNKKKGSD